MLGCELLRGARFLWFHLSAPDCWILRMARQRDLFIIFIKLHKPTVLPSQAWKPYMTEMRKFRAVCHNSTLQAAAQDWNALRKVRRQGKTGWNHDFVFNLEENPLEHVQKHFSTKFSKDVEGLDQTQGATSRALAATPRLADHRVFSGGSKARLWDEITCHKNS